MILTCTGQNEQSTGSRAGRSRRIGMRMGICSLWFSITDRGRINRCSVTSASGRSSQIWPFTGLCTNTYPTIICYQIHNGELFLVTQQLLLCCQWLRNGSLPLNMAKKYVMCFWLYWKAFDSLPHLPLNLENLGFNDYTLHWVSGYLASHFQFVVVNGECSLRYFWSTTVLCSWSPCFCDLY